MTRRTERLNSLLKEVISDVIRNQLHNPELSELITVTDVDITSDLHYAKVFISIIGNDQERQKNLELLQKAAGKIAAISSKLVVMRYFPNLTFKLDTSVDEQMHIDALLKEIDDEREKR